MTALEREWLVRDVRDALIRRDAGIPPRADFDPWHALAVLVDDVVIDAGPVADE